MKTIVSTLSGVFVICAIASASVTENQFVVHFPTDSFSLDAKAVSELNNAISFANGGKYFEVTLDAHTDNEGSNQYNIELSRKRAISVVNYLVSNGMDEKRIQFKWYGESKPVKSNASEGGKQANRRVTLTVSLYDWNSAQDLLSDISENRQEFSIDPTSKAVIECKGGMKIEIPENTFVTVDGLPVKAEDVTIELTEALTRVSWLTEGLSTVSPQGILESGGMFKIEALQSGKPLSIKEGKQISVQVPFESSRPDMSLFYASTDGNENMVWQKSEEPVRTSLNTELPTLNIDMKQLDRLIMKYRNMKADYVKMDSSFYSLTPQPVFTLKPPRMPYKPTKKGTYLGISKVKSWFKTKKSKDESREQAYQRRMKAYERNMVYYNKRLQYYNQKKEQFDKTLEEYNTKQPGYNRLTSAAVATIDSLTAAYEKNIAYQQIYRCLSALKYKLATKQVTDPNYVSNLINSVLNSSYQYDVDFPKEIAQIRTKLEELGYSQTKGYVPRVWYDQSVNWFTGSNQLREIWSKDDQLMSLMNESSRKLLEERLAQGISSSTEMNGYYLTSLNSMGWINLDRFYKQELGATLIVKNEPNSKVYVIFDDINSVMQYGGESMKMPENSRVTVFSVMLKDNLPYYAVEKVYLRKNTQVELKYKEGLLKDIKNAIQEAA